MSFKNLVNHYKKTINYDGSNSKIEYENAYIDNMRDSFFDNIAWTQVTKNSDTTVYDTWIYDGDTNAKAMGHKKLVSYPYNTAQFSVGDYVHFSYASTSTTWIITSLDKQDIYDVNGRIFQCNKVLKWKTSNNVTYTYDTFLINKIQHKDGIFDNKYLSIGDGQFIATLPDNSITRTLNRNVRFIVDDIAYKITFIDLSMNGLCLLTLVEHQINTANDDLNNDIADNTGYPTWDLG
jgi:hypothetical protein